MNAVVNKTAAIPMLRKITPKTISEAIKLDLFSLPRPVVGRVLYDLFGVINGYRQKLDDKNTDKGMWTQFKGQFRAVTPEGEMFESGATHIPVLEDIILSSYQSAREIDPRARVEIALRVAIKPAAAGKPSMTGYEYDVQRLLPSSESATDPIVLLMQAAAKANPPQLAQDKPADPAPVVDVKAADPAPTEAKGAEHKAAGHKGK